MKSHLKHVVWIVRNRRNKQEAELSSLRHSIRKKNVLTPLKEGVSEP